MLIWKFFQDTKHMREQFLSIILRKDVDLFSRSSTIALKDTQLNSKMQDETLKLSSVCTVQFKIFITYTLFPKQWKSTEANIVHFTQIRNSSMR